MDISTSHFSAAASHDIIERLFRAPVERHVLDNGLTLVHRPDFSSEVVSVQVWVKTGSIHEDAADRFRLVALSGASAVQGH